MKTAQRVEPGTRSTARLALKPQRLAPAAEVSRLAPEQRRVPVGTSARLAVAERQPEVSPWRPVDGESEVGRWRRHLVPGWPLKFLLVGFPLWWVLGLSTFIFPIMAVPMALELRRRRPIRLPPLFWLGALFLVWLILSLAMFNQSPPGTHAGSSMGRLVSVAVNLITYAGISVTLLYVGNLPIAAVPQALVAKWMGWFFLTVAAGGFLGILAPTFSFNSVLELVLPRRIGHNHYVSTLVHPVAAQVQDVLGTDGGRPAAPFGYTNSWGNALGILLVWFVAAWVIPARGVRKIAYLGVATATLVPIVLSLNRGLWLGLLFIVAWLAVRQITQGRIGVLLAGIAVLIVGTGVFLVTPLHSVILQRLEHGQSNSIRAYVASQSLKAARYSPLIGYGGTRHTDGSANSIAVGKTPDCPTCGEVPTGSTGHFWAIMFNQGLLGLLWYFGFFAACLWIYRRERGAVNEAALASIAVLFVFMWFYSALPVAPTLTVIAVAVLWRSRDARLGAAALRPRRATVLRPRRLAVRHAD